MSNGPGIVQLQVPWERNALDYLLQTAAGACNVRGFFSYPNSS